MKAPKTVIVTGASQGIGTNLGKTFLERGCHVVATTRSMKKSSFQVSNQLALVDGDIGKVITARNITETAIEKSGSVDVLMNNIGIFFTKQFKEHAMNTPLSARTVQSSAEQQLYDYNIELPPAPTPFGAYLEVVQISNLLFLSGMLPVVSGKPAYLGRIGTELTIEDGRQAAAIACLNVLAAARHHLGSLDKVGRVVGLGVSIATDGDFREHPKVADAASDMLVQVFGEEKISTRIVLEVANLSLGMPIELEVIFEVTS